MHTLTDAFHFAPRYYSLLQLRNNCRLGRLVSKQAPGSAAAEPKALRLATRAG